MVFDSLIYIIDNFSSRNTKGLEKNVIVLYLLLEDKVIFVWRSNNSLVEGKDLEFYAKYWFMFREFTTFFDYIKTVKTKYLPYNLLVTSSCVLLSAYIYIEEPFSGLFL